ncbi:hypothetical protein [Pedomonas sp. V897]|uniref:hypothetical protein n=1 Tax=Pedomonas sp. V897 TaxID=3446482 RepID=UPI003EE16E7B
MHQLTIYDISAYKVAQDLIQWHGEDAILEAAGQADRNRACGNDQLFLHWRAVEHAIQILQLEDPVGELH